MWASFEKTLWLFSNPTSCRVMYSSSSQMTKNAARFERRNVKQIKPVRVQKQTRNYDRSDRKEDWTRQFRKEFKEEISEFGDVVDEPNANMFSKSFDTYLRESEQFKARMKVNKMASKHFKHIKPKEISLLTWAEKENIRYLMETEPDTWTPETISQAYPISPVGVEKLMKSRMPLVLAKEVKAHDEFIANKIKKIKSGEIPMTDELRERLKIRDLIPLNIGYLGMNADKILARPEPNVQGEYARLVAPPPKKENPAPDKTSDAVVNHTRISDGDLCDPNTFGPVGKIEMTEEELGKVIPRQKLMTFNQFENKIAKNANRVSEDMKYMMTLNKPDDNAKPDSPPTKLGPNDEITGVSFSNTSFPSTYHKFKTPSETGEISVNVEGKDAYMYHPETGYQKPYQSESGKVPLKIQIPEGARKPGATYKYGDAYYDDEGDFLYRVV